MILTTVLHTPHTLKNIKKARGGGRRGGNAALAE